MRKKIQLMILCAVLLFSFAGCSGTEGKENTEKGNASGEDSDGTSSEKTENPSGDDKEDSQEVNMENYENQVKVMSYNVYYKDVDARSDNIWDLVKKNDPDVLMLQEVSLDWIPHVQSFMAENNYSYYGYGRYGGEMSADGLQEGDQFTPVLWKTDKYDLVDSGHYWLSATPEVYSAAWMDGTISKFPRCVNWVILKDKSTGGEFLALNIHTDPESAVVRNNSSQLTVEMLSTLRGGRPAVLGGDWNMGITDTAYYAVTEGGYPDVRFKAAETTTSGSFNAWGERADDNYAFGDHIFMSEDMAAQSFEVVNDYYDGDHISDHCPIQAVLFY